ncbi:MAG: hypothetical protein ACLP59_23810 [Bryobacteraceae bacterium]
MLTFLKTVHTIIWMVMSAANLTAFYLAFVGRFNAWFFLSVTLLGGEVVIIAVNSWHCPLTDVMGKYTLDRKANFDIYLPEWLARNNIKGFSLLMALEIMIVLIHRFSLMS